MALTPQFVNPFGQGSRTIWKQPMLGDGNQALTGSGGAAATITVTGQTGRSITVTQLAWSYSAAPTGGAISVTDGTTTYFNLDVTAAGPGFITFDPPIALPVGLSATITLAAPGGAVVGKLFVNAHVQK